MRRFRVGQPDEIGRLVHRRGGEGGGTWAFSYDPTMEADDETGFKLDQHRLVPGEDVSITVHDGVQRTCYNMAVVDLD